MSEELEELGLSANALAKALDVPTNRITAILKGQRGITADTALRLARYLGTTPQLWQNHSEGIRVARGGNRVQVPRSRSGCNDEKRHAWVAREPAANRKDPERDDNGDREEA